MLIDVTMQALLFAPLALGIYLSYHILKIPDLTTDGSFVLGTAIFAIAVRAGFSPATSMLLAACGGACAGIFSSTLQEYGKMPPLIAGILTVFALQSLNLKIMGRPNIDLLHEKTIFSYIKSKEVFFEHYQIIILAAVVGILVIILLSVLKSPVGIMLKGYGCNPTLLGLFGFSPYFYRSVGLAISNGFVGISGSITAQMNGYADIGMGTGMTLIALGVIIIGEVLYTKLQPQLPLSILLSILFCLVGTFTYFTLLNTIVYLGVDPINTKLLIAAALILLITGTGQLKVGGQL
ncbi:MAG: Inner-rane translocator [Chlamydiales bacterium]|jgi:putative ABC transport system permease protein|nr:Inner-rane translocator [Chlamydiales bacterium]